MFNANDKVFLVEINNSRFLGGVVSFTTDTIERVTKTQAIVRGKRFKRNSGDPIDRWSNYRIEPFTQEVKEDLKERKQRRIERIEERKKKDEQRAQCIEESNKKELEAFKAVFPHNVPGQLLPDGSRMYSVLLPGNPGRGISFFQAIVRVVDEKDWNGKVEPVSYVTWFTDSSSSFPSRSGEKADGRTEEELVQWCLAVIWNRN